MTAPLTKHLQNTWRKNFMGTKQGFYILFCTNPESSTLQNSSCTATYLPSHKQDMLDTVVKVSTNSLVMFSLWNPMHKSVDQPAQTFIHQPCVDTGFHLNNLPRVMASRDEWWGIVKGIYSVGIPLEITFFENFLFLRKLNIGPSKGLKVRVKFTIDVRYIIQHGLCFCFYEAWKSISNGDLM